MPSLPSKAFVLAAGLGTRLRPLTAALPKPMLPLWGVPMIRHSLEMLRSWGVREAVLNLHHAPGPLIEYLAARPVDGLRVSCLWEPDLLGTGGALRQAAGFIGDAAFWLVNADVFARPDPGPILRVWASRPRPLAACWLTEDAGPRTVHSERGTIVSFHAPDRGHATFCGIQILDSRILRYILPTGPDSIIDAYRRAQADGHRIAGVLEPGAYWADMGTPPQYVQAHHDTAALLGHRDEPFTLPAAAVFTPEERTALRRLRVTDATPVDVLPPRGSSRSFYRLPSAAIAVRWSPAREDNAYYAPQTRFLARLGIPVPRLLLDNPSLRLLVMEDLGPDTLENRLPALSPARRLALYRRILRDAVLPLHVLGLPALRRSRVPSMSPFGPETYAWEHDYFLTAYAQNHAHWPSKKLAAARAALTRAADILQASPQGLIHRDLQSSNILFRRNAPVLIDYQGMRAGPLAYDLASLLCDPYANLPAADQAALLRYYCRRHPDGPAVAAAFPAAAVQRLGQALGAYATLSRRPGMARFASYIPPALARLAPHAAAFGFPL
jgi:aminoglycoside/choline kinase family phosphotransferase/choline kinase